MKTKAIKLQNGIELATLDAMSARVRMLSPLAGADIRPDVELINKLKARAQNDDWAHTNKGGVSQWSQQSKNDNFDFSKIDDVLPQDGDYINVNFRALSKVMVPGHWIDWTRDNVLEESVPLLLGATVYANHNFTDINGWLGSVAAVAWDPVGANTGGVAGINAQYKIDALMNPRIARGLMMTPPAIHSTSMTVLFEFEYSHPDMAAEDRWKFFKNLGEEIDGEIVRLIVTKINEYWEASLVFQGADRLAKIDRTETEDYDGNDNMSAKDKISNLGSQIPETAADENLPPTSTVEEKRTVKLKDTTKAQLGIEVDGDEVPDEQVFEAIDKLSAQAVKAAGLPDDIDDLKRDAAAGVTLVTEKRAEVTRLAKIAELGAAEGDLDEVVSAQIEAADADGLIKLEKYFGKKVEERFPNQGRSSVENSKAVDLAAGDEETEENIPEVSTL